MATSTRGLIVKFMSRRVIRAGLVLALLAALAPAADAAFPGANGRIAYTRENSYIVTANPDGTGATTVLRDKTTDSARQKYFSEPAWSPDGRRIAYLRADRRGAVAIGVVNADGTGSHDVASLATGDRSGGEPAWSPDGRHIAFERSEGGRHIFIVDLDGGGIRRLTPSLKAEQHDDSGRAQGWWHSPTWSPDGSKIAFHGNYYYMPGLWTINPDGSGLTRIAHGPASDPDWSPDGRKLAFARFRAGGEDGDEFTDPDLFTINRDGSGEARLTGPANDVLERSPAWSPDGSRIVFTRLAASASASDIYVMDADGTRSGCIPGTSSILSQSPSWRPARVAATAARLGRCGLPAPERGETVNVRPTGGVVMIREPRERSFRRLQQAEQVPVGSVLDTRRGKVSVTSAGDRPGKTQTASFHDGRFRVEQPRRRALTTMKLVDALDGCAGDAASAARRKRGRRLWGNGKGKFKTKGKLASAGTRGTRGARWLVADRCDGSTLVVVRKGRVTVRDHARGRTVVLRGGQRYVARSSRSRR